MASPEKIKYTDDAFALSAKNRLSAREKTQEERDIETLTSIYASKIKFAEVMKKHAKKNGNKNQGLVFWQ